MLMPPEDLHPCPEENHADGGKDDDGHRHLAEPGPFDKNAADAIGHHGQREFLDGWDAPGRKIVIAEKYS